MAEGVSLLSERHVSAHRDPHADMETVNVRVPTAKYTKMGETLRHVIPGHMQCSMACGGRACKYENASRWSDEEQAVKGLYSSWITDHLLAMARPSTETIEKFNVIQQFQLCDLRTVVNLQRPGEHASCGGALEPVSGFTYRPEVFMEAGIFFYNFGWKDYGVASLTTILDMVKVMSFAMQEGKIAVHCHAGLGRTGVLIACFLVFTSRMSADQAILFVRAKRPNSIQTRGQLLCVREFAQFLVPLRSVFSCAEPKAHSVTLPQYLIRQRHLLHGYEARHMKNLPKIVHLVCRLLLDIAEDRPTVGEEVLEIPDLTEEVEKTVSLQAIRQLGKEMQGKGIPSFPPKPLLGGEQEFDVLLDVSSTSQLLRRRSLSYSDSALNNLDSRLQRLRCSSDALGSKSGSSFTSQGRLDAQTPDLLQCVSLMSGSDSSVQHGSVVASCNSLEQAAKVQASCSPLAFNRVPLKEAKRSMSYGLLEGDSLHRSTALSQHSGEHARDGPKATNHLDHDQTTEDGRFEIPIFTFQSELTPETRHQLVAKALTMDLQREDLRNTVSMWQTELNSREGAWERLCGERDPVVLSALLWSWLEQLKEPAIAKEDLKALTENRCHPQQAVSSLEKGQRETLLCVLDCVAHLLKVPESIESALIERTIKAFTWISSSSENERIIYTTLKDVMTHLLRDLRLKVTEETEMNT